jgi:hypothetical protein
LGQSSSEGYTHSHSQGPLRGLFEGQLEGSLLDRSLCGALSCASSA